MEPKHLKFNIQRINYITGSRECAGKSKYHANGDVLSGFMLKYFKG
jgi:hypothetical protein